MSRRTQLSLLPLGALLLVALSLGAVNLQAGDEVPFKGRATSRFLSEDLPNLTTYWEIVSGNVTHLGTVTGGAEVYWRQIRVVPPIYVPVGAAITLVAANGDEVYVTHGAGTWDPDTATAYSAYTVTGGTGRFEGASGSGTATASGSGTVSNTWDGTIDY